MPKYPKGYKDVEFFPHKTKPGKRVRRLAGSTKATSDFLVVVCEEHPDKTISQLREMLMDKRKFIYSPEAISVLDAYIKAGEGDIIPRWK